MRLVDVGPAISGSVFGVSESMWGGGFVVVALLLVIVLVPQGQAAQSLPEEGEAAIAVAAMSADTTDNPVPHVLTAPVETVAPLIPTTAPDPNDVGSTDEMQTDEPTADPTETPEPVATTEPEPDPTPTPKPDPTPTPKPDPTPTPKPDPTPTPKPDPTPEPVSLADRVKYFRVEADEYYNYSSNYYEYTEDEWYVLAQLIDGEAGNEPTSGQIAVGNVVMNRVLASGYPGSDIITVVVASDQFSGYSENNVPNKSSKAAA